MARVRDTSVLAAWVAGLQAAGRYTFTLREVIAVGAWSKIAIQSALRRLR
jgi:hypothetical protein